MKIISCVIILLLPFAGLSQTGKKRAFYFFDANTKMPVQDVIVKDYSGIDTTIYVSNARGQIVIPQSLQKLQASHLNYRDTVVTTETNKVLLSPSTNIMTTAVIQNKEKQKGGLLRTIVSPFVDVTSNMSHGTKAALFIPADKKNIGKMIERLKYEVVDVFGVKNLKYLPFKAAVYSVDSITGLPDKPVYVSEVIKKKDSKKWVAVDVSAQEINMPEQGLFIVFEVLDHKYYEQKYQRTIWSKVGRIDAAPTIRAEMYNFNNPRKCYYYSSCLVGDCEGYKWYTTHSRYVMDIEFIK